MRFAIRAVVLALAAVVLVGPVRADATDDEIKAMKELEAAGKVDECVAKMDLVRAGREKRAYAALSALTVSKHDAVACAAIHGLAAGWRDADTFRWLVGKIDDRTLYDAKSGRPEVYKCVLASMREFPPERVKQALKPLADAVARFMSTNAEFTDLAIRAYGTVPDRFTVQQMLQWLDQAGAPASGDAKVNKDKAKTAVLETLTKLCGTDAGDAADWKKWWAENGKTFKFPEAPKQEEAGKSSAPAAKPGAEMPDPSALAEWKDDYFGWSVKKPEAEGWSFFRPDYAGPRVGLLCGSEQYSTSRAYIRVHDPAKYEPKDVAGLAKWAVDVAFKDSFGDDGLFAPAETKTVTLNGVEWTIVIGKGLGAGGLANWGSIERRFYFAKMDPNILCVDAYVRLSTEKEEKEALWACIEAVKLPAKK